MKIEVREDASTYLKHEASNAFMTFVYIGLPNHRERKEGEQWLCMRVT